MIRGFCSHAWWDDEQGGLDYCRAKAVGRYEVWVDRTHGGVYALCQEHVTDAEDAQPEYYIFRAVTDDTDWDIDND